MTSLEFTYAVCKLLNDKKAVDVKAIHVEGRSSLADYFVIASGGSTSLVSALEDEIYDKMAQQGKKPLHIEGANTNYWVLMDYGDVLVHLFLKEAREFYGLERLWADAPQVDLSHILTAD